MVVVNPKKNSRLNGSANPVVMMTVSLCGIGAVLGGFFLFSRSNSQAPNLRNMVVDANSASIVLENKRPYIIYGTAWKEDQTARLVSEAVHSGFRFIDTACQPKHYDEAGVGTGWTAAAMELGLQRSDFWLQTKFTPRSGQDPERMPYNAKAPIEDQVRQSIRASLENLHTHYIDSLVLHSPLHTLEETVDLWAIMEEYVDKGVVRSLGISNCYNLDFFADFYKQVRIKPSYLQNRFHHETGYDVALREFANKHGVTYQSFWTLTANRAALDNNKSIRIMAKEKKLTPHVLMYAFMMTLGHTTPLSGTTSKHHMKQDAHIMERMQAGEVILNKEEMKLMAQALGIEKKTTQEKLKRKKMERNAEHEAKREEKREAIREARQEEEEEEEEEEVEDESKRKERQKSQKENEEKEAHELAKTMMNKKAARLYGRMQHGIAQKKAKVDNLHKRRRDLELEKDNPGNKSMNLLKLERKRKERKEIGNRYTETGGTMKKKKKKNKAT